MPTDVTEAEIVSIKTGNIEPIIVMIKDGLNGKGGKIGENALYECNDCGARFWDSMSSRRRFCSKKCYTESQQKRILERAARWKTGRVLQHGYWKVKQANGKYVFEHRLVMENHLGRKLMKGEDIHHINFIKTDNRIENLKLMSNKKHHRLHGKLIWKKGVPRKIVTI